MSTAQRPPKYSSSHLRSRLVFIGRGCGMVAVAVLLAVFSQSSSAEFEVPFLSSANVLNNVQFRGIWAQNRGQASAYSPFTNYNRYEAYAVGVNTDIQDTDCAPTNKKEDCNGIFYYYDGTSWSRVVQPLTGSTTPIYSLNAITGQMNHGEGATMPMVVAGSKSRISVLGSYYYTPGVDTFTAATVNCAANIGDAAACTTYKDTHDFYTLAAAQTFATGNLAGGQKGLVAYVGGLGQNSSNPWTILAPKDIAIKNSAGTTLRQYGDSSNVSAENMTQMKFSNIRTAYAVTSTFSGGTLDRTCANAATQTSRLYVIPNIVNNATPPAALPWTQLVEVTGLCFFGLDIGTRPETPTNFGPQQNIIWIATNNGVYKFDEKTSTFTGPLAGTVNKPMTSIVAIQDRGGSGQTLIDNGGFESLTVPPAGLTADQFTFTEADTWLSFNTAGFISRNNPLGLCTKVAYCTQGTTRLATRCEANIANCTAGQRCKPEKKCTDNPALDCTADATVCSSTANCQEVGINTDGLGGRFDKAIAPSLGNASLPHSGAYAFSAQPGVSYNTTEQCLNRESPILTGTSGVIARVPLSTIEGQKFRVSGWYKVSFPSPTGTDATATMASAGVSIGCSGAGDPNYFDCSFSNRSLLRTPGHPTSGWEHFSIDLSRENQIFGSDPTYRTPIIRSDHGAHITERDMMLEVRCQATYGATVVCDDIVIESIDTPPVDARDTFTVIAAGQNIAANTIVVNSKALQNDTFTTETLPTSVRSGYLATPQIMNSINSMAAVGLQHVFAVGEPTNAGATSGVAIYSRTPSTLTGSIWSGARTSAGASATSLGDISVSCVSAEGSSPTLCQRSPESYGLSLEITSAVSSTIPRTGMLSGRAWLGKSAGDDNESLDLGSCLRSPLLAGDPRLDPVTSPYNLGGKCSAGFCRNADGTASNLSCANDRDCTKDRCNVGTHACVNHLSGAGYRTCNINSDCHVGSSCDEAVRRCWADASHTIHSDVSCISEFDCYGRCQRDEGFLCVTDDDCKLGATSTSGSVTSSTGALLTTPGNRLTCGKTVNSVKASPLACTPVGWLTFSKNDYSLTTYAPSPPAAANTQIGGVYNTKYLTPNVVTNHNTNYNQQNQGAHEISGWGRFTSLTSTANPFNQNGGWVHLRSEEAPFTSTSTKLFACRNCDGGPVDAKVCAFCQDSNGASCVPSNTPAVAACHYECVGSTDPNTGEPYHCSGADSECTGKGGTGVCSQPGFCTNNSLQRCSDNSECGAGTCAIGAVCNVASSSCVKYGVNLDTENNKMYGSAWSQDFGWLDFSGVSYGGNRVIQTKLGDIYATQQIGRTGIAQPQGGTSCNSTYLITSASTITGFCSSLGTSLSGISTVRTVNEIPFVSAENTFENILGRFDLIGIETPSTSAGNQNKYKSTIVNLTSVATADPNVKQIGASWSSSMVGGVLGGKVYKVGTAGDTTTTYTLDDVMTFNNTPAVANSLTTNGPGSGILIVNGNLKINNILQYASGSIDDLRKLASLMIVVRGDLTINKSVENIVGAYYVTGTIHTSSTNDDFQHKLVVNGLFMAKQFDFARKFTGTIEAPAPSELVIYDGRLQSNPLPGMVDFTSALPNSARLNP